MATKMELVLSPGNLGGDSTDGGPFRNEDVQEWSHVDQITGMLERARVETGRWRANTRDAAHSYGKMVDSRERNSADGSLVQKARRQVEVFQSQGTGGRSFQVVKASQWSSSRATDSPIFDVPISKLSGSSDLLKDTMNGNPSLTPRINLWRASLDYKAADLEQLSSLCRQLHDEALSQSAFWPLRPARSCSPSPSFTLKQTNAENEEAHIPRADNDDEVSNNGSTVDRRSNSSEDLTSLPASATADDTGGFARDCRARRSLQISSERTTCGPIYGQPSETRLRRNELVALRARKFEEGARRANETAKGNSRNFISTKRFSSIADNDFVKNDPKHPSKLAGQQVAKITFQDGNVAAAAGQNSHISSPILTRSNVKSEPVVIVPAISNQRKVNNTTVIHLRNVASPDDSNEPTRCINVTAIKAEKDKEPRNETPEYSMLVDATSNGTVKEESLVQQQLAVTNGMKPVKKVEFCKTEIHFEPDSGKVNIVETDGKPPPTNKFRRRRRNNSLTSAANTAQKSNLPLVHFGDTSYEKFIFGGQGKLAAPTQDVNKTDNNQLIDENNKNYNSDEELVRQRWNSPEIIGRDDSIVATGKDTKTKDSYADCTNLDRIVDHSNKQKGAHTTTVNFLNSENSSVVPTVGEGSSIAGIRLQFAASSRSLSPINLSEERGVVSRTTKITVHLPAPAIYQHHPLQLNQFSNLKSVRLVMSIGKELRLDRLLSLCDTSNDNNSQVSSNSSTEGSPQLWTLKLNEEQKVTEEKPRIIDQSRMIEDKSSKNYPSINHVAHKEIGPLERRPSSKAQIISKDTDNNQVSLKIVTTHKPILARVENDHLIKPLRPRTSKIIDDPIRQSSIDEVDKNDKYERSNADAKAHCDNTINGKNEIVTDLDEEPMYENVFDAVSDGTPVYENFQVVKSLPMRSEKKTVGDNTVTAKKKLSSEKVTNGLHEKRHRHRLPSRANNDSAADGSSRSKSLDEVKVSQSVTPISTLSSAKSDKNSKHSMDNPESKRIHKSSSRSNGLRENSIRKYKEIKPVAEDGNLKGTQAKRKTSSKDAPQSVERKGTPVIKSIERNGGSVRSKKQPVEVVYQTAVYNIKNENLTKPKIKEIKEAISTPNTSKRKETSTAINR